MHKIGPIIDGPSQNPQHPNVSPFLSDKYFSYRHFTLSVNCDFVHFLHTYRTAQLRSYGSV